MITDNISFTFSSALYMDFELKNAPILSQRKLFFEYVWYLIEKKASDK